MFSFNTALISLAALIARPVLAGTTIWSGSFDYYNTSADFDTWSWANPVGEYQWYIHGSQNTSHYLALDPSYKNPADTSETHGLKLTIDSTSTWNSQFERSELIPQTKENLGQGELFYHFSMMRSATNAPDSADEHQMVFFESHFTEMKYGVAPNASYLEWHIQSQPQWGVEWEAGTWYNFAYDIDFDAGTVGLWASTGGDDLVRVMPQTTASTSTNSEDWHLGVLRLVNSAETEDFYFSGVYIENGPITASIAGSNSTSSRK
ncbi:hypothetical protein CONPUDRAFT_104186 [Coniophora puteana RWD-64-598 SS2]|uniref:Glycoside hydrolase 131 catalytic N-terminal domain-containing protein n=1 Tax=Coniophora puteana (strain RWD-64-598) TaxID=741705 RepID=A0A5M3MR97_CONPW|nr:uncharacterized protein CONPUDRAFT_104186 [Coniophora puteana RWD-64-598 SS2]EIW81051.1 hypothetical protein CONPUDRAFT_104186 [Coniophora puteana RWD-64-598 SS2]